LYSVDQQVAIRRLRWRALKRAAFQSLHEDRQSIAVPPKRLDAVGTLVDEDEQIACANVMLKLTLDD